MPDRIVYKTVHLVFSENDQRTLCTKEPYSPPEIPGGMTVQISVCSVCKKSIVNGQIPSSMHNHDSCIDLDCSNMSPHKHGHRCTPNCPVCEGGCPSSCPVKGVR